jgi:hypothetical protein
MTPDILNIQQSVVMADNRRTDSSLTIECIKREPTNVNIHIAISNVGKSRKGIWWMP